MISIKYKIILSVILFFILLSAFLSCEEFTGSQTESNLQTTDIIISGSITDIFTQNEVSGASVQLGENYQATSDVNGQFSIHYQLTTDDERNKPVSLQISAANYIPFKQELLIFPVDYQLKISLTYAAPIIRESVLVFHIFPEIGVPLYVCQALVEDYQGYQDIDSVKVIFYYLNSQTQEVKQIITPMVFIAAASFRAAYYEATAYPDLLDSLWQIRKYFDLSAIDSSGYSTYIQDMVPAMSGDLPLFPPVYLPPDSLLETMVP
jgi:hypothetical protein